MASENLEIKFPTPPVHFTKSGAPYIDPEDIFHSKVGQDIIFSMANMNARLDQPGESPDEEHGLSAHA